MACGGERCREIYQNIYPKLQEEITSSVNNVNNGIDSIIDELSALVIPDDYLGGKVRTNVESIVNSFSSDKAAIASEQGNINQHIANNIAKHKQHYSDYLKSLEDKKDEETDDINSIDSLLKGI